MLTVTNPPLQKQESKPPGYGEMLCYAMGSAAGSLVALGAGTYLNFFWSDIALIPLGAIGSIMLISRILDGGTDILIGFLVDRTNTRWGKARPWLLWMALPGFLSLSALYFVPNLSETGRIIYAFITYNCVAFFINTAMALPLQSLLALITDDPKKRVTINMFNNMIGTTVTVLSNMIVLPAIEKLGGGQQGYFRFFTILSALATIGYLITFAGTRERVQKVNKDEPKIGVVEAIKLFFANKWWIVVTIFQTFSYLYPAFMSINMYYMTWIMKDPSLMGPFQSVMFTAMLVTLIVGTPIVPRVGKINAAFAAMLVQTIGNLLPLVNTTVPALMVASALRGGGPAILLGTTGAFMCDVVEYGEWKTGRRIEGLTFSAASMGGKVGLGLGGLVVAFLLARGGYVGGAATQTPEALNMIKIIFTWCHQSGSLVCTILLFILRKLDAQMPQIMADLAARRQNPVN